MAANANMKDWVRAQFGTGRKKPMPILSFPAISLLGVSVRKLIADSGLQAEGMKAVAERCPTAASVSMMDLSVEAEAFGCKVRIPDDEVPTVIGKRIEGKADVDRIKVPPISTGRTAIYIEAMQKALDQITDRPVFAGAIGPFSLAGRLMDMNDIMIRCYDEPDMVHRILEKATEFIASYVGMYKKIGASGVVMAEPAAGLLSPGLCEEFSSPYVKRIADEVRDDSFVFVYHNCGRTIPLKDSLMAIDADVYHLGNAIDIEEMLRIAPADKLFMGNVDPSGLFRMGTPEMMRESVLALLARCGKYPNYSISSGCDIPPLTPWGNLDAFFAAIDEHYRGT